MKRIKEWDTKKKAFVAVLLLLFVVMSTSRIKSLQIYDSPNTIVAVSGSAVDIQTAVDEMESLGGGTVFVPAGVWDFVAVGETWKTVTMSARINIVGAPLVDKNLAFDGTDQRSNWQTILRMPEEAPSGSSWFIVTGREDLNENPLVANIAFIGYRDIDPVSTTKYTTIKFLQTIDFRVSHCLFRDIAGVAINVKTDYMFWLTKSQECLSRGVVDHCKLVNSVGVPEPYPGTVDYGIMFTLEDHSLIWEPDINNVLGKYTRSVYVEGCYFEKWRHSVSINNGAHLVLRNSIINNDFGYGSIDAHGYSSPTGQGSRAIEVYNNQIIDPEMELLTYPWAIGIRGGGGVIFNNVIRGYTRAVILTNEAPDSTYWPKDIWLWDNTLVPSTMPYVGSWSTPPPTSGVDYFLYEKPNYTPYPYPHPLVTEVVPTFPTNVHILKITSSPITEVAFSINEQIYSTPYSGAVEVGTYVVTMPLTIKGTTNYSFSEWSDGAMNATRTLQIVSNTDMTALYIEDLVDEPVPTTGGGSGGGGTTQADLVTAQEDIEKGTFTESTERPTPLERARGLFYTLEQGVRQLINNILRVFGGSI